MADTDVRISDLDELAIADSGDFFAIVETGATNTTKKITFGTLSGQLENHFDTQYAPAQRYLYTIQAGATGTNPTINNGFNFSFGQHSGVSASGHGAPIVFDSKLIGLGIQGERIAGSARQSIRVVRDGSGLCTTGSITGTEEIFTTGLAAPINFDAGTVINFQTRSGDGNFADVIITAHFATTGTTFNF